MLKLILLGKKTRLRMLEKLINQGFGSMQSGIEATYSGISKRFKVIKWEYFEGIYKDLVSKV
ncbi:hypothetical protein, partial [Holospora undulata]|uniref:hypothetical protein n=1 Tax=Holospora undulata TaxID=1169117 RepID=UPI0005558F69